MNAERPHSLGLLARKQLYILETLQEEWEAAGRPEKPLHFGWQQYERWVANSEIADVKQLLHILEGLEKSQLITKFEWFNPAM